MAAVPASVADGDEGTTDKKALLEEARANYKIAKEWWEHNQKAWLEDAKFRAGEQWNEDEKKVRKNRPMLVVDKIGQYIRQVVNDGRQNRPAVKVHPVDDGGDEDVAEGFQGIIRRICRQSNADDAYDTALDHAAGNGFGYIRVITDYAHENTFNQEIFIRRIRNPISVLLGPHEQADGSDAKYGFAEVEILKTDFKKQYPNAKVTDWDDSGFKDGWANGDYVRVCEYFYKEEEPGTLHLLVDGTSISDDDYQEIVKNLPPGSQPIPIKESREIPLIEVKWCRLSGAEILEENEWLGKYIPIIPVYGNESDIEGKVTYSGLVRLARDPQKLYNFARSAFAERVALTPKAPFMAAEEAVDGHEEWKTANTGNHQVLKFRAYNEAGQQLPQPNRINPSDVPAGYAQEMQLSEHDIQSALGMYAASVGQPSNEKSGRAIMARQREGDTSTFHYQDNLNRAIRHLGRILVDLIPKVYDSTRVVRILNEDGTTLPAQIDPNAPQPMQQINGPSGPMTIYNLNVGTYDVSVEAGPSYTTKRQEALDAGMQLAQANPQIWGLIGDIIVRNADWPGADEISKRLKAMLPPQIQQMESQQQPLPPEVMQAMQQVQQGQQQLTAAHAQLMEIQQKVGAEAAQNDADRAKLDAAREKLDSEEKLLMARYQELSAKLELQALKAAQVVPATMPTGTNEPAIASGPTPQMIPSTGGGGPGGPPPNMMQQPPQAPPGAFLTPGG